MRGLLYKEAVAMWQNKLFLLMLLVFAAMPTSFSVGYCIAFSALVPMTLIQIDEQARWGRLSVMLPYSNLQLVLPRYFCAWATLLLTGAIMAISNGIRSALADKALDDMLLQTLLHLSGGMLLCAVITPLFFRFGTQRGRIMMIVVVALCVSVAVGFSGLNELATELCIKLLPSAVLLILTIPASALSVYLSQRWYRKGLRV